jgi:phosphoglycolate phosphatase-like HAD superfamily hydrolase
MAENIKQKTLRLYKEKKEKEKEKKELLKKIKDGNLTDTDDEKETKNISEHESDDSLMDDEEIDENELENLKPPYFYIDYDEGNIQIAKDFEYKTLTVKRNEGLDDNTIKNIFSKKMFDLKKTHIVINCWKVLTKSNLNIFSYDCSDVSEKKFQKKMEEKIKWGSKPFLKERLTRDEQKEFTPFRDGVDSLLKSLYHHGVKIFIVSNADYTFVKRLFEYYRLDKYIEAFFTPSVCGLPSGKLSYHDDSYNDRRKINKARVFVCIERYIGRLPLKN